MQLQFFMYSFSIFSHRYLYEFYVKYCMKSYIYGMYTIHCRNLVPIERDSPVAQLVRIRLQCWRPGLDPWVGKIPWRRQQLPTPVFWPGEFHGLYRKKIIAYEIFFSLHMQSTSPLQKNLFDISTQMKCSRSLTKSTNLLQVKGVQGNYELFFLEIKANLCNLS